MTRVPHVPHPQWTRKSVLSGALGSYRVRLLHLTAVWAYGVSQPIFSLIDGNASFLVLRDSTRADAIAFALLLTLGLPLAAIAYVRLAALLSQWVGDMLYLAMLAVFLAPIALRLMKSSDLGRSAVILAVVVLCGAGVASYVRWRPVRFFVGFSIVLPAMALISFVHGLPVSGDARAVQEVGPRPASRPPVVMVVFDEFPVASLMHRNDGIDAVRYPSFGRLARAGTWYRNATTVHDYTDHAVPAILTGQMPSNGELPILRDHPRNLFTLLGGSYSYRVHEETTRLCPESYCPPQRTSFFRRLQTLIEDVSDPYFFKVLPRSISRVEPGLIPADKLFHRRAHSTVSEFETFIDEFSNNEPSGTLHFIHVLLPHVPWRFLPSGREYGFASVGEGAGQAGEDDPWLVQQRLQRHLLQVAYADALLGRLLDRLDEQRLLDRSLIVVAADHGASFWSGADRRDPTAEHLSDIASVPLFVKSPGQTRGRVDLRAARTTDVLPTVADVLGLGMHGRGDGVSLLASPPNRDTVDVLTKTGVTFKASTRTISDQRKATARRNASLFGEGLDSLYRIGTTKELLGVRVRERLPSSPTVRVRIEDPDRLRDVRLSSTFLPVHISGVVQRGVLRSDIELAVSVNGRIRALTRCFRDGGTQRFRTLVPETALVEGANRIDVFAIEPRSRGHRLVRIGSSVSSS